MREHLYRGKRIDNGEWVYGDLIKDYLSGQYFIHPYGDSANESDKVGEEGCLRFFSFEVIPETICEFTGLTDKNGNKIFEGDILLKPNWYVAYANGENESYGMACGWYLVRDDFESWSELTKEDAYEVIGNIYDNPELLNDKND